MKKTILIFAFLLSASQEIIAQNDRYSVITNPDITCVGTEEPRSSFTSYCREQDVLENKYSIAPRLLLNGKWKFNYVEKIDERPLHFMDPAFDVSDWKEIIVPGNWELQGCGMLIYVNMTYEFTSSAHVAPFLDNPNHPMCAMVFSSLI